MNFVEYMEKPRILIVDDDPDDLMLISGVFAKLGYANDVKLMQGGKTVIDYLSSPGPENVKLIVLDMNMPILNGIDTLRILKSDSRYRQIPVIIFSTSVSEQDRNACQQLGAIEFVTKPTRYLDYMGICQKFHSISQNVPFNS